MKNILIFAAGAIVGSAATYIYMNRKNKVEEESITWEEMKNEPKDDADEKPEEPEVSDDEDDIYSVKDEADSDEAAEYEDMLKNCGYDVTGLGNEEKENDDILGPVVIHPDEYGEIEEYDEVELMYWHDGILTDDYNEPIEDVAEKVGPDFYSHFGEFEEDGIDTLHIRNDKLKCYYEISCSLRDYVEYIEGSAGFGRSL